MARQHQFKFVLINTLAALLLLVAGSSAASVEVSEATSTQQPQTRVSAAPPPSCPPHTPFNPSNFSDPATIDNPWYPLLPGTQYTLEGRATTGGQTLPHRVIFTVTDLTKIVNGVRTVVMWNRDLNEGILTEAELAFHAQDDAGNIWNLGEYPELYSGGQFTGAPDTWFAGQEEAMAGTLVLGDNQLGTPVFLQGYAPKIEFLDCGQVFAKDQQTCVPVGCYNDVLVIDETSPPDPEHQRKYYTAGVGNIQIGAVDDPEGENLVMIETKRLTPAECDAVRAEVLKLEQHAYQVRPDIYGKTAPVEHTGSCAATNQPTSTPPTGTPATETPTATATETATETPTLTATSQNPPTGSGSGVYLPIVLKEVAGPSPTATSTPTETPTISPTVPPAVFDNCRSDPNPASAPNTPIRIVSIDKVAEVVTLQNISDRTVSLEDWNLCSINGNEEHDEIAGTIAPGQVRTFPNIGDGPIWADNERDDAALYSVTGFIVSYYVDQ